MPIIHLLERGLRMSQSSVAISFDSGTVSYRRLIDEVRSVASQLRLMSFGRGDRIGVISPNSIEAVTVPYGILACGATYVPVPPSATATEIHDLLSRFECSCLAYHASFETLAAELKARLPDILFLPVSHFSKGPQAADEVGDRAKKAAAGQTLGYRLDDTAWLIATGGTTGRSKGVEVSWKAVNAFIQKFNFELALDQPVMLLVTPLTHAAGMLAMATFASGGHVIIADGVRPDKFTALIERHRVTTTFLPPTAIYKLLDYTAVRTSDFTSLRNLIYGAAPIAIPRLRQALAVFGPVMTQVYGQSECHTFITLMRPGDHFVDGELGGEVQSDERLSACGRPNLGNIIEIRDEHGVIVDDGQVGEICVSSDLNMTGYFHDEAQTALTLVDGFVLTGDLGFFDAAGFLHIVDRKKDMVITGGFNVYPSEVEAVLAECPAVAECAVVGVPHHYWGEIVVAVVRPHDGATIDPSELRTHLRGVLGSIKAPKAIHVWSHLPKSGVGKILKREIRDRLTGAVTSSRG